MRSLNLRNRDDSVNIYKNELRQLIFWASVGVSKSKSGSYEGTIVSTIREWNARVGYGNESAIFKKQNGFKR